ncbi:MAG TPA: hypothetical protein VI953_02485 [Candidatus Paceibacterota bacterium]
MGGSGLTGGGDGQDVNDAIHAAGEGARQQSVVELVAELREKNRELMERLRRVATNSENLQLELDGKQVAWLLRELADGREPDLVEGG